VQRLAAVDASQNPFEGLEAAAEKIFLQEWAKGGPPLPAYAVLIAAALAENAWGQTLP